MSGVLTTVSSAVSAAVSTAVAAAPGDADPSTGKGPEWGKAAPIGLLIILLMGIALFFLLRSMTRRLKKVPDTFDPPESDPHIQPAPQADGGVRQELTVAAAPDVDPASPGPVAERPG